MHSSRLLDCFLQCEFYRLLERQRKAFLPGAIEGSVISKGRAGLGQLPVMAGPINFPQR